jgi:hypothetical protein
MMPSLSQAAKAILLVNRIDSSAAYYTPTINMLLAIRGIHPVGSPQDVEEVFQAVTLY